MAAKICIHLFMILLIIIAAAAGSASAATGNTNIKLNYIKEGFTKELNVETLTKETYTCFLENLRTELAEKYLDKVPVLPMFMGDTNPPGFDVVLTSGTDKTTVRFRGDNLYVVGYQMQKTKKWYEFGKKDGKSIQQIQGSEFLGFYGDYTSLEKLGGKIVNIEFNHETLIVSVQNLAYDLTPKKRAKALLVVIQMMSEAARFVDISNYFASNLVTKKTPPDWMVTDLEKNWSHLSEYFIKSKTVKSYKFPPPTINKKVIQTANDLGRYFGILYRGKLQIKILYSESLYDEMKNVTEFEERHFGPAMVAQA